MPIDQTEIDAFNRFLAEATQNGGTPESLEDALARFRAYQRNVDKLRAHLGRSDGDLGHSLDTESLKRSVRKRLADQGIMD